MAKPFMFITTLFDVLGPDFEPDPYVPLPKGFKGDLKIDIDTRKPYRWVTISGELESCGSQSDFDAYLADLIERKIVAFGKAVFFDPAVGKPYFVSADPQYELEDECIEEWEYGKRYKPNPEWERKTERK